LEKARGDEGSTTPVYSFHGTLRGDGCGGNRRWINAYFKISKVTGKAGIGRGLVNDDDSPALHVLANAEVIPTVPQGVGKTCSSARAFESQGLSGTVEYQFNSCFLLLVRTGYRVQRPFDVLRVWRINIGELIARRSLRRRHAVPKLNRFVVVRQDKPLCYVARIVAASSCLPMSCRMWPISE
jgi:hypothetical protein